MDGHAIQQLATQVALELPQVSQSNPFGPEHEVFKVVGKVFVMTTEATGHPLTTLKCDPQHSILLRQTYVQISPGWHVNKKHWISIAGGDQVQPDLIEELVIDAYALVVDKLPRAVRPVLPDEVAQALRSGRA